MLIPREQRQYDDEQDDKGTQVIQAHRKNIKVPGNETENQTCGTNHYSVRYPSYIGHAGLFLTNVFIPKLRFCRDEVFHNLYAFFILYHNRFNPA